VPFDAAAGAPASPTSRPAALWLLGDLTSGVPRPLSERVGDSQFGVFGPIEDVVSTVAMWLVHHEAIAALTLYFVVVGLLWAARHLHWRVGRRAHSVDNNGCVVRSYLYATARLAGRGVPRREPWQTPNEYLAATRALLNDARPWCVSPR
jgi:hypothetical protein